MDWQGWFTLIVIGFVFASMLRGWWTPDLSLLAAAIVLAVVGVITADDLVRGFSNPGMLTIAALFVVAGGLRETGALDSIGRFVLRRAETQAQAVARVCPQVSLLSAFLNNTAVVAMLLPVVSDWCRRQRIAPSRMLIPLSYAAVLGGTCTLIGTSTNLIVNGLMIQEAGAIGEAAVAQGEVPPPEVHSLRPIGFFEVGAFGLPAVVLGLTYLLLVGRRLLPDRTHMLDDVGESAREYLVNMRIADNSPLIGQQVIEAGLRHLPGLFLIEILREHRIVAPVAPNEVLRAGDRLTFTGVRSTIVDLERFPGLERVDPHDDEGAVEHGERYYCEAVVSSTSPLIGRNIRDSNFRALYNAVVVAVHRGGTRLKGRVGDIVLHTGDTLLLQTGPNFRRAHANNPDFFLVSGVREGRPVRRERAGVAFALLIALVALMASGIVPVVVAAFLIAGLMIFTRCIAGGEARRSVQWNVLLAIASALAVGAGLMKSGAASSIAHLVVSTTHSWGPMAALAAVYIIAVVFTELITNSAAAVLVFPVALSTAAELGVDARPFVMAVVFGASFGFSTPIGYQTNLMVYGPGGYRFTDFLRVGLPLTLLLGVLAVLLIPRIWPLAPVG